jgi:hypothetical protein
MGSADFQPRPRIAWVQVGVCPFSCFRDRRAVDVNFLQKRIMLTTSVPQFGNCCAQCPSNKARNTTIQPAPPKSQASSTSISSI